MNDPMLTYSLVASPLTRAGTGGPKKLALTVELGKSSAEQPVACEAIMIARCGLVSCASPCSAYVSSVFDGTVEEHLTMLLRDPSNNLLELEYYIAARMMC